MFDAQRRFNSDQGVCPWMCCCARTRSPTLSSAGSAMAHQATARKCASVLFVSGAATCKQRSMLTHIQKCTQRSIGTVTPCSLCHSSMTKAANASCMMLFGACIVIQVASDRARSVCPAQPDRLVRICGRNGPCAPTPRLETRTPSACSRMGQSLK